MAHLTLCADDYGLSADINDAILTLVRTGRLNAVSCMAIGSVFDDAPLLAAVTEAPFTVQVGLHLTLTEYTPLAAMPRLAKEGRFPSVGSLLAKSHLRQTDRAELREELARQFDAFERTFGRKPDFVDGHQHVHIFPGIREDVAELAAARMGTKETGSGWVRCCAAPMSDLIALRNPRAVLLNAMSRRQRPHLLRAGLHSNQRFYGVNTFDRHHSYRTLMQAWLKLAAKESSSTLIMCHPGLGGENPEDPIAARRADEFSYLQSDQFEEDLLAFGMTLGNQPQ